MGKPKISDDYHKARRLLSYWYDPRHGLVFGRNTSLWVRKWYYLVSCFTRSTFKDFFFIVINQRIDSYVDEKLKNSKRFKYDKIVRNHPIACEKLKFWTPELCALQPKSFDFIITVCVCV